MSQTTGNAPKRMQNSKECATILVRVGEQSWVVCDPNPQVEAESAQSESNNVQRDRHNKRSVLRFQRILRHLQLRLTGLRQSMEGLAGVEGKPASRTRARWMKSVRGTHGFRPTTFTQVKRQVRDSFKVGLIAGLMLGCLSLVMFHQVEPSNVSSTPAVPSAALDGTNRVMLPAAHVEVLQVGSNLSTGGAKDLSLHLQKAHIPGVLWHSSGGLSVITAIAIRGSDVDKERKRLAGLGMDTHLVAVQTQANSVPVGASLRASETASIERWLSAASSALNSMIAVSADGGNQRDAVVAALAEVQSRPSHDILMRSGYEPYLARLEQDLSNATAAIHKNHFGDANLDCLKAEALLNELRATATGT